MCLKTLIWFSYFVLSNFVEMEWDHEPVVGLHETTLRGCDSVLRLRPNLDLSNLFENDKQQHQVTITTSIVNKNQRKTCEQDTYSILSLYEECGISKAIPLLPAHKIPAHSQQTTPRTISNNGDIDYIFDGGTAIRFPPTKLPPSWYESAYSITGWVLAETIHERQYIFSWSSGDSPRHDNTGLFLTKHSVSNHITFGFHHMHTDVVTGEKCSIQKKWKLHKENNGNSWNFFALSFYQCSVQLLVNNQHLNEAHTTMHLTLPEKHIQPKFIIGARWVGSVHKYDGYFHGRISGIVMKVNADLDNEKLQCLYQCKENIKLAIPLPSGFQKELTTNGMNLRGVASKSDIEKLVQDIVYVNTQNYPENEKRVILFQIENTVMKRKIIDEVDVHILRESNSIYIRGYCLDEHSVAFTTHGIRLCENNKIVMDGCVNDIDSLTVNIKEEISNKEKLFVPTAYLKRYQLNMANTPTGIIVYGVGSVSHYTEIVHHVKYANTALLGGSITRTVTFTAFSSNGLIKSNEFTFTFTISPQGQGYVILPVPPPVTLEQPKDNYMHYALPLVSNEVQKHDGPKTNHTNHHYGIWIIVVCVLSSVVVVTLIGYGYRRFQNHQSRFKSTPSNVDKDLNPSSPFDFYWDEEGLPMRLKINPLERVSITNDPYSEILLKEQNDDSSTSDSSIYSDDDGDDTCDNDSIRQLEWDSLENSLESLLENEMEFINENQNLKDYYDTNRELYLQGNKVS